MSAAHTSARILVVGDTGVGKSSLVHLLCTGQVLASPPATLGCHISVKVRQRSPSGKLQFVEFFEIGGNPKYHREARFPFYHSFHAIIFVHDLSDEGTLAALWEWHKEIQTCAETRGTSSRGIPATNGGPPPSRVADTPYASISQRRATATVSRTDAKGPRHRATTQCFDATDPRRPSSDPYGSGLLTPQSTSTGSELNISLEDDCFPPGAGPGLPPILIVGTKADLGPAASAADSGATGTWQRDLLQVGAVVLRRAAQLLRRALFMPAPGRPAFLLEVVSPSGSAAGAGSGPVAAADLLQHLRREWGATALDICCHRIEEDKLHKVELFTDKVMDSVFSLTCRV